MSDSDSSGFPPLKPIAAAPKKEAQEGIIIAVLAVVALALVAAYAFLAVRSHQHGGSGGCAESSSVISQLQCLSTARWKRQIPSRSLPQ